MKLKEIRKSKGLKQKDIAEILHIDRSQVSRYENGDFKLNSDQIIEICRTLNTSADYLLGLINNNDNKQIKESRD